MDLENICGPGADEGAVSKRLRQLRSDAGIGAGAYVVCAGNKPLLARAAAELPDALMVPVWGRPDEADLALIAVAEKRLGSSGRFNRVVIASGDGIFTRVVDAARAVGAAVTVAGPRGNMSKKLAACADVAMLLRPPVMSRRAGRQPVAA